MQQDPPRRRRARPVADAPIDTLLWRAEDLAKGWLIALLEQAPLREAPAIVAADLARDGPRVCDAVVRALADDTDLRRLEAGGALELLVSQVGEFAGAQGIAATARAADTLHAVVWSALLDELPRPDPDQIAELAQRLTLVIELVRAAALRRHAGEGGAPAASTPAETEQAAPPASAVEPAAAPASVVEPAAAPASAVEQAAPAEDRRRASVADALWVRALEDEIQRSGHSGTPLSLLLAELEDAERVAAVEPQHRAAATFGRFAQALRGVARRQDILACETDTRAWLIARDTGRGGAQALGSRIASAVRGAQPWRGAPMVASVGVAVLGEDGLDSTELIEAAEEARFAASAGGVGVMRATRADHPSESPSGPGPRLAG